MSDCFQNNVYLLFLPPHTSHILQPLDIGCFSSLKRAYRRLLTQWLAETHAQGVRKMNFLDIYARARQEGLKSTNIKGGWRGAGIWPVNRQKALSSRWVLKEKDATPPPTANSVITTPKRGHDVQTILNSASRTPGTRLSIRKIGQVLDTVTTQLVLQEQEVRHLKHQVHELQPKKRRKVQDDMNEKFMSLGSIDQQVNPTLVTRSNEPLESIEVATQGGGSNMANLDDNGSDFESDGPPPDISDASPEPSEYED